tara:strand:+ start:2683 stop:3690 length:1008 start_codon:yes stop_codon:yes gene_type:complete
MRKSAVIIVFIFINTNLLSQCLNADSLYVTNITHINSIANWVSAPEPDHYLIHYRILGTTNWSNLGNIDSTMVSRNIPQLQPLTTYEWQIKTFCDTSNQPNSGWSPSDTFTTIAFVATPFKPIITNNIDKTICNTKTNLTLTVSQTENEPDIETSTITSDGGYFDIQSVAMGDSVGYATINISTQTILTTLRVGIIAGQNYAIINSYDSLGVIIGFFAIENVAGGIKVSSTSPNDGNNYTSGFTSEIYFSSLFVNPNINGPLHFYTDIKSELGDQFNDTNAIMITCTNSIAEEMLRGTSNYEIYDLFGRPAIFKKNTVLIYKCSNGKTKKIITIE